MNTVEYNYKKHGDDICPIWGETVLSDENGNCSLCGHDYADEIETIAGVDSTKLEVALGHLPSNIEMACDAASAITEYIVRNHTNYSVDELEIVDSNGDIRYSDRVQDIFGNVLDLVDKQFDEATA